MVFLQNSLRSLAGNFRAEFDPEQGIRIPEQGIWRPPGNPDPARLCGAPARGRTGRARGCVAASVHSAFDDVRLASQFESPPSTRSPSSTPAGRMAGVRRHKWPDPAVRIGTFPRRVVTARLSVADRVLDQFSADGAEENYLYCNPAPNGDKRHADR